MSEEKMNAFCHKCEWIGDKSDVLANVQEGRKNIVKGIKQTGCKCPGCGTFLWINDGWLYSE